VRYCELEEGASSRALDAEKIYIYMYINIHIYACAHTATGTWRVTSSAGGQERGATCVAGMV